MGRRAAAPTEVVRFEGCTAQRCMSIPKVCRVVGDAVLCQERKYFFLKALHLMVLLLAVKVAFHRFQIIMPNGECEVPVLPRERR